MISLNLINSQLDTPSFSCRLEFKPTEYGGKHLAKIHLPYLSTGCMTEEVHKANQDLVKLFTLLSWPILAT